MKLKKILDGLFFDIIQGNLDINVESLCWDSRKVIPNSLFICVKNRNVDRHAFALEAIKAGAVAIVLEHEIDNIPANVTVIKLENTRIAMAAMANNYFDFPSKKLNLIGITGTNGKTSVAYFISKILESSGRKSGIIGTIQNSIGDIKLKTDKLNPTTPDSIELQSSLYEMLNLGVTDVAMEVTSSALEQNRVLGCDFDIGVFTNLTQDHLDEHGNMENYKSAKLKLFKLCKKAVINLDDDMSQDIISVSECGILTYGIDKAADFRALNVTCSSSGSSFTLLYGNLMRNIVLNIPGRFNVYNALAAIAVCYELGLNIDAIVSGLSSIKGVPGRFELVSRKNGVQIIVDYAHTPDSLMNILNSVRHFTKGRVITVFGCGGNRDTSKRSIMGEIAGMLSDYCILTSDNPRKENPTKIIEDIEAGISKTKCVYEKIESRRNGILAALSIARPNDAIVIAGKGHETYQIIENDSIHFDDREVVRDYFNILSELNIKYI